MSYTTVHMRHTSSGSSSSRDAKDVFITDCRNNFDFSQITPEKISKLSKESLLLIIYFTYYLYPYFYKYR